MSYSGDIYAFSLVRKHPHLETKVTILGNKVTQSLFSTSLGLCWTLTIPRRVKAALAYFEPLMKSRLLCDYEIFGWPSFQALTASVLCPK